MAGSDKTEKPTAKRLTEARKKGQTARSSELPQSISLIVSAVMLPSLMPRFFDQMADIWYRTFSADAVRDPTTATETLGASTNAAIRIFAPMAVAVAVVSVAAQLALVGLKPNPHKLKPRFSSLSPKQGVKRLFSVQQLWELGRTVLKLAVVALIAWSLWDGALAATLMGPTPMSQSLPAVVDVLRDLFMRVAVVGVVIGLGDALWNKWKFARDMRMTKQDVTDESKQQESNPVVKAEIRRRQQLLSRNRMISAVAGAQVVITNPTHLAVALAYDDTDPAPRVVAKGAGAIAAKIREEARLHGVPIRENKPIARTLFRTVELGEVIPVELYAAIAEILAAVLRAKKR